MDIDIKGIVTDVFRDYIRKMAYKKNKQEDKIQVVLYLKKPKEVSVYILEEYQVAEDVIRLKDLLGTWAISYNIVNGFISKALQNYAKEYDCDFELINCMIWLSEDSVNLYLYKEHTPLKEITLSDLLK